MTNEEIAKEKFMERAYGRIVMRFFACIIFYIVIAGGVLDSIFTESAGRLGNIVFFLVGTIFFCLICYCHIKMFSSLKKAEKLLDSI